MISVMEITSREVRMHGAIACSGKRLIRHRITFVLRVCCLTLMVYIGLEGGECIRCVDIGECHWMHSNIGYLF